MSIKKIKKPNKETVFLFHDTRKRGFRVRLLEKGNPVPEDVIVLDLLEKGGILDISLALTPSEANAVACGLLQARMEHENK